MNIYTVINNLRSESIKSHPIIFIRHAEKDSANANYLTPNGIIKTIAFAKQFDSVPYPIKLFTSPESRCQKTAEILSKHLIRFSGPIVISNFLGKPGAQIIHNEKYKELYSKYKCREIFNQWKKGMYYDILETPENLKNNTLKFLKKTSNPSVLSIYISQSGTVASIGYAMKLLDYDTENGNWINFLDGFAITDLYSLPTHKDC